MGSITEADVPIYIYVPRGNFVSKGWEHNETIVKCKTYCKMACVWKKIFRLIHMMQFMKWYDYTCYWPILGYVIKSTQNFYKRNIAINWPDSLYVWSYRSVYYVSRYYMSSLEDVCILFGLLKYMYIYTAYILIWHIYVSADINVLTTYMYLLMKTESFNFCAHFQFRSIALP